MIRIDWALPHVVDVPVTYLHFGLCCTATTSAEFLLIVSLTFPSLKFPSLISLRLLGQHNIAENMKSDPQVGKAQLGRWAFNDRLT